jgi:outer membrane lipoprotein
MRRALALVVLVVASGCLRPPTALRGTFAPLTPRDALERGTVGERVRWGGKIVSVTPGKDSTCFEILSRPLDRQARPVDADDNFGRFVACASGFYDPAVYAPGREITVTGMVAEPMMRKVGEYEYRYPVVTAETVHLWPKRDYVRYEPWYDPWYDPWWGPPLWGWGARGFVTVPAQPRPRPPRPPRR